ncbi:MAG: hypothetical protein GY800_04245 [Planctomycetes bacterium]|nr:hypothetical protein [Planctomycetota bacterium]
MSSLLQIKAEISGFLKIYPKSCLGDFELTYVYLKKPYFFKFCGLTHCAILDRECSTLWENDAKNHIFTYKKEKQTFFEKCIFLGQLTVLGQIFLKSTISKLKMLEMYSLLYFEA